MIRLRSCLRCLALLACCAAPIACERAHDAAKTPVAAPTAATPRSIDARPFPRRYPVEGQVFEVHQPQLESWDGRTLKGRFAMSVQTGTRKGADGKPEPLRDFGVVWFSATTQVDAAARMVVLTDVKFERAAFPNALAREAQYLQVARAIPGRGATWTMSLDQLESELAVTAMKAVSRRVQNTPPEIIFSTRPAILILVDGKPVLRPVGGGVDRILNTRSLLLRAGNDYYTRMAGHWARAPALMGPWAWVASVDAALEAAVAKSAEKVETLDKPTPALETVFAGGGPSLYVRLKPAELISVQGEPSFVPIPGTSLSYIDNTGADVFVDGAGQWYVVVSGRWFTAPSTQGPWSNVRAKQLPADFARIPPDSPKSGVLASIPGTPESREALIANSLPQTASVSRGSTALQISYDGEPVLEDIEGTGLQFVRNTPVPVIHVPGKGYYAVDKGVWFYAKAPEGPWAVADSVPEEIYQIPTSSPLHYVTYVRVYGHNDEDVFVGYTPGYYGTVVSDDVVVYGTGYECDPWVGEEDWYGCPATYGLGTYFGWNPWVGWSFGWGWGWYDGWYGPYDPWWGPWWGGSRNFGDWRGGAAAWNVYERWGNAAVRGTAAAWVDRAGGNVGRGARGAYANAATGVVGAGRAAINRNVDAGRSSAVAGGIRYDSDTGRVSRSAVFASSGPRGAAGIGAMVSDGSRVDAAAVGGFHYNADTGNLHHGGVASVNDNVYASRDGEVYRYRNGEWSKVDLPRDRPATGANQLPAGPAPRGVGSPKIGAGVGAPTQGAGVGAPGYGAGVGAPGYGAGVGAPGHGAGVGAPGYGPGVGAPDLDQQRYGRERGNQRYSGGGSSWGTGNTYQSGGNSMQSSGGGYSGGSRPVGGYRSSLGASPARGGGGRRR